MKRILEKAAIGLLVTASLGMSGVANAGLSWQEQATATRAEAFDVSGITPMGGGAVGTTVSLGKLVADTANTVVFTVLGEESGFSNNFHLTVSPFTTLADSSTGASASILASVGLLQFKFEGDTGVFFFNGDTPLPALSIGLIGTNMTIGGNFYEYVIGYNDSAGSATELSDWDDMVVGVSMVPEPEIYAMMAAGLGLMGFVARRRKQNGAVV